MCLAHIMFLEIGLMFKNLEISLKTQIYGLSFKIWGCGLEAGAEARLPPPWGWDKSSLSLLLLRWPHCLICLLGL